MTNTCPEDQFSLAVERSECNVEQCAELERPAPVSLDRMPDWLRRKLRKRFGPAPGKSGLDAFSNALWRLDLANTRCGPFPGWTDHWGKSHSRGEEILVCEPWQISGEEFQGAVKFARQAGLQLVISSRPSWRPGHIRLEFHDALD